jgi:tetratricopeptide (TPR) repeat protein
LVRSELAAVSILQGDSSQGEVLLLKVLEAEPENQRALCLLAMLASQDRSTNSIAGLVTRIRALPQPNPNSLLTLAILSEGEGDLETAREDLERILAERPGHSVAMERLLKLDVLEGRMDLSEKHVRDLLAVSPRNALGNQILGSIQYTRGELVSAEVSLRVSVEEQPSPAALNSLAWIVLERGQPEEALELSEKALQMNDQMGHAWDTKGMALRALDRLDEAEKALVRAIECEVSHPSSNLNLAKLYAEQGRVPQAIKILEAMEARGGELPAELYNKVTKLLNELNESS